MKKIIAFLNNSDRKSSSMETFLTSTGLPFEVIDLSITPEAYAQMVKLSGQTLTPCVIAEGNILDATDEAVLQKQLGVNRLKGKPTPSLPKNKEESAEQTKQRAQRKGTLRFF